jgi:hypothetical protein
LADACRFGSKFVAVLPIQHDDDPALVAFLNRLRARMATLSEGDEAMQVIRAELDALVAVRLARATERRQ